MLETWAIFAIAAAFFQNLRSATQKYLKGSLSDSAAAYARFIYALPFALLYLATLHWFSAKPIPAVNQLFFIYCLLGSLLQILFTVTLLWMFSFKSFVVGTTFSKLEVIVVAVLGAIILKDGLSYLSMAAIVICSLGVVTLATNQSGIEVKSLYKQLVSRNTGTGLLCALFLGGSVVCFRGASLSLKHNDVLMSAALTLAITLVLQTVLMGIWLHFAQTGQWRKLIQQWRWALLVGFMGALASICWFTAFSLQNAGFVRAVGTVELLFSYLFSVRVFRERVSALEIIGITLIVTGIVLLLTL